MKTSDQMLMEMMGRPTKERSLAERFCRAVVKVIAGAVIGVVLIFAAIYFGAGFKDGMDRAQAGEHMRTIGEAAVAGRPAAGMTVDQAEAALGKLRFDSSVGSEKGQVDIYVCSGYRSSYTLYFANGRLKRWIFEKAP